jgi:ATP-dependent helicase/DNAse subunit B
VIAKSDTGFVKDALFISYTSLKDFDNCPKAYYLKNIYRDPKTGYKLQIASPYLTLGAIVHDAIKWFLQMDRQISEDQLIAKYKNIWLKYRGKKGGFPTREDEAVFGKRGIAMLKNFFANIISLEQNLDLDNFYKYRLDATTFLNGRLDFLGLLKDGTLHVMDFKTGSRDEEDALQLYIYAILAESNLQKEVSKISYWYLDRDSTPKEAVLDSLQEKLDWLKGKAEEIKQSIISNEWICVKNPERCRDCQSYQDILDGKGEYLFSDDAFKKVVYYLAR